MKVVFLTSNSLRHKYIAFQLSRVLNLSLIVVEKKSSKIEDTSNLGEEDSVFVTRHFENRAKSEFIFFKNHNEFPKDVKCLEIESGKINENDIFNIIKENNPDRIILFGTSIIKDPLLDWFKGKIINLHLGLSPYYKGSATNLFPILKKEFECIGATIHEVSKKVDDGPILHQLRPNIEINDTIHDVGNKVIKDAGLILPIIINEHFSGKLSGKKVLGEENEFKIKDLSVEVLRQIYLNFNKIELEKYLIEKEKKYYTKPIIESISNMNNILW